MKRRSFFKKFFYLVFALMLSVAVFTGCGGGGGGNGDDGGGGGSTYTVTYDGNGATTGTVPVDDTDYTAGQSVTVPGNTGNLEKTGSSFTGWNTAADGSGTTYTQGQSFTMGSADIILYARWSTNPTYTVIYDGNGATGGDVPVDSTNYENGQTVTVLGNTGNFELTGYSFSGWNTAADGSGTTYTGGQSFTMESSDITLYARWTSNPTYTVTYDGNGATGGDVPVDSTNYENGQTVTVLGNTGNLVNAGYTFFGWNTASDGSGTRYTGGQTFTMGSVNVVLYAMWENRFVTTWKTDNTGDSDDDQITIPVYGSETYDYTVDWGDGNTNNNVTGSITHTYASVGTYTVSISGTFPRMYFNNTGDREKILTIENWGDIEWTSMASAFYGCSNLTYNAIDAPDLSGVTDMSSMFLSASSFNGDISSWDVSNVTNMNWVFNSAYSFNGDISSWDVSSVTSMRGMFWNSSFNGDISGWDVSSVLDMYAIFSYTAFNGDINSWDVSSVTNMQGMFSYNSSFNGDISGWNVSSVTDMRWMFYNASAFSNHDLSGWTVVQVTEYEGFSTGWGTGNTEPTWP